MNCQCRRCSAQKDIPPDCRSHALARHWSIITTLYQCVLNRYLEAGTSISFHDRWDEIPGGYSDLVWTGMFLPIYKGHLGFFFLKSILRNFGVIAMQTPGLFRKFEKTEPMFRDIFM